MFQMQDLGIKRKQILADLKMHSGVYDRLKNKRKEFEKFLESFDYDNEEALG